MGEDFHQDLAMEGGLPLSGGETRVEQKGMDDGVWRWLDGDDEVGP